MLFIKAAQTALNQGLTATSLQAPAPQATAQLLAEPIKAATATVAPHATPAPATIAPPVTAATASVALQVSAAPLAAAFASHEQAPVANAAPSSVNAVSMDSRALDYRLLDCQGKIKAMQERDSRHHTNHMVYMTETATLEHLNCHFRLANLPLLNTPCAPLFIILHKPLILLVFLLEQNINKPHNHMAYLSPPIQSE